MIKERDFEKEKEKDGDLACEMLLVILTYLNYKVHSRELRVIPSVKIYDPELYKTYKERHGLN